MQSAVARVYGAHNADELATDVNRVHLTPMCVSFAALSRTFFQSFAAYAASEADFLRADVGVVCYAVAIWSVRHLIHNTASKSHCTI